MLPRGTLRTFAASRVLTREQASRRRHEEHNDAAHATDHQGANSRVDKGIAAVRAGMPIRSGTLRTLQTPFVKNKNDDKERNAHPERCGRERNLKRRAR